MRNITQYRKQAYVKKGLFVYLGTAALVKGYGMDFDLDHANSSVTGEKVADPYGARGMKVIEKPSGSNNMAFAGVLTQNYAARLNAGYQMIELAIPGGCAMIASIEPTVINSTRLTCMVPSALQVTSGYISHAGLFGRAALPGRGTAIALKTNADGTGLPWTTNYVADAAFATATGTITGKTDTFQYADEGDVVWVLSGGIANAAHAGKYYIKTVTDDEHAILSATKGGDAVLDITSDSGILAIAVIPAAEPLTLAYLCDGEESGLQEFDVPVSNTNTNPMVGGTTNMLAGVTLGTGNHTPPIADGLFPGMLKMIRLGGVLTSEYYVITPATLGLEPDGTALNQVTLAASGGMALLRWTGQKWDCLSVDVHDTVG